VRSPTGSPTPRTPAHHFQAVFLRVFDERTCFYDMITPFSETYLPPRLAQTRPRPLG
jgi:hypothetical protein